MAFKNRIRLPMQLHSPQFPEERQVFRKANGEAKTMSVIVRKTYELETDFMPEKWHQRLKIALAHDIVTVEAERYLGNISQDGDYNIEWPDGVLHYPTAKGGTKVQVTPFDASNVNCQTCDEASQLNLEDDEATGIYGALQEDQDYSVSTAENDSICCYPAVFSIVSYNSDYLTSASIDPQTGEFSFHTGTNLMSANGVVIATYRVTCPSGAYDEANITADIEGSVEGCLAPTDLDAQEAISNALRFGWEAPDGPPDSYEWELYEGSLPVGSPVATGTETDTQTDLITGLENNTEYYFRVRSVCGENFSNWVGITATTLGSLSTCGQYNINYTTVSGPAFATVSYTDCNGDIQNIQVLNNSDRLVCALQTEPGIPVNLSSTNPDVTINYLTLC